MLTLYARFGYQVVILWSTLTNIQTYQFKTLWNYVINLIDVIKHWNGDVTVKNGKILITK